MSSIGSYGNDSSLHEIQKGIYGATILRDNEPIYIRMELLTEDNENKWSDFARNTTKIAGQNIGVLSSLVYWAGREEYPTYDDIKESTGFTEKEFVAFTKKTVELKEKIKDKIVKIIKNTSVGSNHMDTNAKSGGKYIVYATKNPNFSIQNTDTPTTLKQYFETYQDILIAVGSNFSEIQKKEIFENRGIFRNPYWVLEEKYSGLSMLLLEITGAFADQYFPEKTIMKVRPTGSMQSIIQKTLNPGEGYIKGKGLLEDESCKVDITELKVSPDSGEGPIDYIKTSALVRIYNEAIKKSDQK